MKILEERKDDIVILRINEDINFENAGEIKKFIVNLAEQEKVVKFIIDLENVGFIDSSGLGTLVSSYTFLKKLNGVLKIVNVNDNIAELFHLTRLDSFFEVYSDLDQAIASFK